MQKFFKKFSESVKQLRNVRTLTIGGLLIALYVLLGTFVHFYPSDSIKISFEFIILAAAGFLCGPVMAMLVGGVGDILAWLVHPHGALIPGITIATALAGMLFGLFFYKERIALPRCITAAIAETVVIELLLKVAVLASFYSTTFWAMLITRVPVELIMTVIMCFFNFAFLKMIKPIKKRLN
ncbi:MAG: folate family ECF transporter S component [Clostridia bacterium]|nr:folate family ECF transporter S component [Clostridia bacterium]